MVGDHVRKPSSVVKRVALTERTWAPIPDQVHHFTDGRYFVDVEIVLDSGEEPIVVGMSVRRATPIEPEPPPITIERSHSPEGIAASLDYKRRTRARGGEPPFVGEPRGLSTREVRRMRLDACARAAVAWARVQMETRRRARKEGEAEFPAQEAAKTVWRTLVPRGRPSGPQYYRELLDAFNTLVRRGERAPAKAIAKRMGIPNNVNLVHQRLFRARQLEREGKLPPSRGERRRKKQ
jgi:hypothetical protein